MALVAYDYDSNSESGEEDTEENTNSVIIVAKEPENTAKVLEPESSFLSSLPKAKTQSLKIEEDTLEDFIPKAQPAKRPKEKVKITIPSLSQYEEDEPEQKKPKTIQPSKGSGLLALLPPVKTAPISNKTFIPHSLKLKPKSATNSSLVPNNIRRRAELAKKTAIEKLTGAKKSSSDVESDDEIELPETFDEDMWKKVCGRPEPKKIIQEPEEEPPLYQEIINIAPEPVEPYDGLDNEAFSKLVGKSKRPQNIKLIDINEEEVLQDKDLWLTKQITDPDGGPKPAIENPVDPTRKKKHHITYLAEQAKANEQELQSQWSSSKHTRNQTRAKYGF